MTEACGEQLRFAGGTYRCVNPSHKGAHAWHRDQDGVHVTIVWWSLKPPPKRKRKTQPTQEELT